MTLFILQFILGLCGIVYGADKLTDGASAVARRFNVSTLIIGLTIVAFGTSMPEFVVSTFSAIKGNNEIAIGNVIGSNLFNVLAIVGLIAVISPLYCERQVFRRDIPVNIAVSLLLLAFVFFFDNGNMIINRWEGILLLVVFAIYLAITISTAISQSRSYSQPIVGNESVAADSKTVDEIAPSATKSTKSVKSADSSEKTDSSEKSPMQMWKAILLIIIGLALLIVGGDQLVDGASGIAQQMGVSQSVIALTIVAIGTSLPELATSVVAAHKGDNDMAIGNVVGSNIFNILFILGASATIVPMNTGNIKTIDFIAFFASAFILWLSCANSRRLRVNRFEGAFMLLCIITYYVYVVMQA